MLRNAKVVVAAAVVLFGLPAVAAATTCDSVAACVLGNNTGTGVGLEGVSQLNVALYGVSTANHGIDGRSRQSYGVVGYTFANGSTEATARAGVYGIDDGVGADNSGVTGQSTSGYGILGGGAAGVGGAGTEVGVIGLGNQYGGLFENNNAILPALGLENAGAGPLFEAKNGTAVVAAIDNSGNEILAGTLTQSGTPAFRTRTTSSDVTSYGDRTATPALEDFGTAQLRSGSAFVRLDPTFASAIDARSYLVFITPHGDSNGLYALTGPGGFSVRENKSGRATLAFDYRIVAKPLATATAHLPAMAPMKPSVVHRPSLEMPVLH